MGTYNSTMVETKDLDTGGWCVASLGLIFSDKYDSNKKHDTPFNYQSYPIAALIGGIRNYYILTPIARSRGLPDDHESIEVSVGFGGTETVSRYGDWADDPDGEFTWVLLRELLDFDYDQIFENRRGEHVDTVPIGSGVMTSYRDLITPQYFKDLEILKTVGNPDEIRIIWKFS